MDVSRTEDEQLEALKKWWSENGVSIVGGIVIGVTAIFGWRGWQEYQLAQAEAASIIYTQAVSGIRQGRQEQAREAANSLLADYTSSGYATYAALLLAKMDVGNNELESAAGHLQWALDQADQDALRHLIRIRLGRVYLAMEKPDQALAILEVSSQGEFTPAYEELKGDIYVELGQTDRARQAYELALAESGERTGDINSLQMKLDNIGRSKP